MMQKCLATTFIIFFLFSCLHSVTGAEEITGRQIMEQQKERHKVTTEYDEEIMVLVDKSSGKEKRIVKRYSRDKGNDLYDSLIIFLKPADIYGTALLTWEQEGDENDQWLYLPASKKMQRIAKGSKKNYFMGTDFTYEDLEPEDIDNFNYTILRTETLKHETYDNNKIDNECYVIESVPSNTGKTKESSYSKRLLWVEKKNLLTLKVEFYDRREKLIKIQTALEFENISSTIWRPKKNKMDNLSINHKTYIMVQTRKINEPIADHVFTERFIEQGNYTQ